MVYDSTGQLRLLGTVTAASIRVVLLEGDDSFYVRVVDESQKRWSSYALVDCDCIHSPTSNNNHEGSPIRVL